MKLDLPVPAGTEPAAEELVGGSVVTRGQSPSAELDHDLLAQQAAIAEIAQTLRGRKPIDDARIERLLASVLDSTRLERFDLYQRTELELGQLLARHTPRSDPFLAAAEEKFEWAKRQNDRHLPAFARAIVRRLGDLWFLSHLQVLWQQQGEPRICAPQPAG